MNDNYKACRWCKWYDQPTGTCRAGQFGADDMTAHLFYEEGILSGAIDEVTQDIDLKKVIRELDGTRLSLKAKDAILAAIREAISDAEAQYKEDLGFAVSDALISYAGGDTATKINNPREFHCCKFW